MVLAWTMIYLEGLIDLQALKPAGQLVLGFLLIEQPPQGSMISSDGELFPLQVIAVLL